MTIFKLGQNRQVNTYINEVSNLLWGYYPRRSRADRIWPLL